MFYLRNLRHTPRSFPYCEIFNHVHLICHFLPQRCLPPPPLSSPGAFIVEDTELAEIQETPRNVYRK